MNRVEIKPSESLTYLGIVLDQKLTWTPHKVQKAIKFLHTIKPAIDYIYGLSPARMQWIWKQILLPRITYGCHVWGHSFTQQHKSLIKSAERLTLRYYAPMWKMTPTASLQVILNQKPECPALADVRQELFNDSFPTQLMGRQSLCQVSELALCGSLRDLIERTDQNLSNVCSTEQALSKMVNYEGNGLRAALEVLRFGQFYCLGQELRMWKTIWENFSH